MNNSFSVDESRALAVTRLTDFADSGTAELNDSDRESDADGAPKSFENRT